MLHMPLGGCSPRCLSTRSPWSLCPATLGADVPGCSVRFEALRVQGEPGELRSALPAWPSRRVCGGKAPCCAVRRLAWDAPWRAARTSLTHL